MKREYVLVEARTHFDEIDSPCQAMDEGSIRTIETAFNVTKERFNIKTRNSWLKHYYQLANRLAFINFMLENGIDASLLNIYFINGYVKRNFTTKKNN
ncbi:MAG: hypothetical protein LBD58_09935 [Treponema sp.]|nr:hypothetical protein [Treponema sp.]